jgi:Flp pilus assembly protein TadG
MTNRRQQGMATVEFAIVGAVFLLLIFAVMELGLMMYTRNHVTNVAREAARYAALHGSAAPTPATVASIQSFVISHSEDLVNTDEITVTTTWLPNNNPGSVVRVQVQYPFPFAIPFIPADVMLLQGTSEMVVL